MQWNVKKNNKTLGEMKMILFLQHITLTTS